MREEVYRRRSRTWTWGHTPTHIRSQRQYNKQMRQPCRRIPESTRSLRGPNHCWSTLCLTGFSTATMRCFPEPLTGSMNTHVAARLS